MFVLRKPLIGLMQNGQFDAVNAANTSRALAGLALGLTAFSVYLFVMRGFYAHQDTRTPFVINLVENLINIALAVVLVGRWGVLGLGLAYTIAYLVSSVWALQVMSYKVRGVSIVAIARSIWPPVLAAVLMAEAMWIVTRDVSRHDFWHAAAQLIVGGLVGLVVYVAVLYALRAPDLTRAVEKLTRRHAPAQVGEAQLAMEGGESGPGTTG
jgi:putative peptidoglycan lipid II flippase